MYEGVTVMDDATREIIDLIWPMGPVVALPLFGTLGLYLEDRIFGVAVDGRIYFRTNARTIGKYTAAGSAPLVYPSADGGAEAAVRNYHQVPADVLADRDVACAWAYEAAATDPS